MGKITTSEIPTMIGDFSNKPLRRSKEVPMLSTNKFMAVAILFVSLIGCGSSERKADPAADVASQENGDESAEIGVGHKDDPTEEQVQSQEEESPVELDAIIAKLDETLADLKAKQPDILAAIKQYRIELAQNLADLRSGLSKTGNSLNDMRLSATNSDDPTLLKIRRVDRRCSELQVYLEKLQQARSKVDLLVQDHEYVLTDLKTRKKVEQLVDPGLIERAQKILRSAGDQQLLSPDKILESPDLAVAYSEAENLTLKIVSQKFMPKRTETTLADFPTLPVLKFETDGQAEAFLLEDLNDVLGTAKNNAGVHLSEGRPEAAIEALNQGLSRAQESLSAYGQVKPFPWHAKAAKAFRDTQQELSNQLADPYVAAIEAAVKTARGTGDWNQVLDLLEAVTRLAPEADKLPGVIQSLETILSYRVKTDDFEAQIAKERFELIRALAGQDDSVDRSSNAAIDKSKSHYQVFTDTVHKLFSLPGCVAFSNDGTEFVHVDQQHITLYSLGDRKIKEQYNTPGESKIVNAVFSPDDSLLALGNWDAEVIVLNKEDMKIRIVIETDYWGHKGMPMDITQDSTFLTSNKRVPDNVDGYNTGVGVWRISDGSLVNEFGLKAGSKDLCRLEFSEDGKRLLVCALDERTMQYRVWDLLTKKEVYDSWNNEQASLPVFADKTGSSVFFITSSELVHNVYGSTRTNSLSYPILPSADKLIASYRAEEVPQLLWTNGKGAIAYDGMLHFFDSIEACVAEGDGVPVRFIGSCRFAGTHLAKIEYSPDLGLICKNNELYRVDLSRDEGVDERSEPSTLPPIAEINIDAPRQIYSGDILPVTFSVTNKGKGDLVQFSARIESLETGVSFGRVKSETTASRKVFVPIPYDTAETKFASSIEFSELSGFVPPPEFLNVKIVPLPRADFSVEIELDDGKGPLAVGDGDKLFRAGEGINVAVSLFNETGADILDLDVQLLVTGGVIGLKANTPSQYIGRLRNGEKAMVHLGVTLEPKCTAGTKSMVLEVSTKDGRTLAKIPVAIEVYD